MDAQRSGALTDSEIDVALSAALAVEPSTEFLARVRTRIASEPEPSAWLYPWTLAAAGAMALAFASAVAVLQMNQAMPPAEAVLAPLPSRALVFASLSLVPGMVSSMSIRRPARSIKRPGIAVAAVDRSEPEVLIDAGEAAALRRLFTGGSEGRIDLTMLEETARVNAAVLDPIEIVPIIIEPLRRPEFGRSTSVTKCLKTLTSAAALATALGGPAVAQEPAGFPFPVPPAQPIKNLVPLKVQVVVSRYQGEKKVSSLPYTLSVNNDRSLSRLRMGSKVAVLSGSGPRQPSGEDKSIAFPSYTYQDVGTNIDCYANSTDDGRFRIEITIQDTSVYSDRQGNAQGEPPTLKDIPTFRTFTSSQTLILKDGQTTQFTTATDRVSGEVTKVDVTLTVVK